MKCVAITPEKTVFDQEVKFVVVPLYDGEYGVGANHSPVVGRLGVGELRLTLADKSMEHWYVEGGFVEVANNVVTLLTNRACKLQTLDLREARKEFADARALPSNTPELTEIKIETVDRARAKLRAAEKARQLGLNK
ncbi:MAG: ATP synthase F1 subunit epsilon [Thermoguttaceae bacterium]